MKTHPAFQKLVSDIAGILGPPPAAVADEQRKAAEQAERKRQEEAERFKVKEEAVKRETAETTASRIPEPTHPPVPPTAPRSSLKMITVLGGGILVVAILIAVLYMTEREPVRQSYDPGADAPAKTAEPSKTMPLGPETVEIPETAPDELPDTQESPGVVEASAQPGIITAPSDMPLSRSQWAEVQRALNDIGFNAGATDGIPGSKTRSAIALFQERREFPTSGQLTEAQRKKLLSDAREAAQGRLVELRTTVRAFR